MNNVPQTKANKVLGWESSTTFDALVQEMVEQDLKMAKGEAIDPEAPRP